MTFSIPETLRNGRTMIALFLLELMFILLLFLMPISKTHLFRLKFNPLVTGTWFVGILAFAVLALPRTSGLVKRYRQNGRLQPVPFVPGVDVPLVGLTLLAFASLAAIGIWPIEFWRLSALFFFCSILVSFGVPVLAARICGQAVGPVAPIATLGSLDFRDNPIFAHEQDLLDRNDLIARWCSDLRSSSREVATLYGFYGPQGGGKTSLLNLLWKYLEEHFPNEFLVVPFDPWYFAGQAALVDSFYGAIDRAVNQRYLLPNLRRLLARYSATLKAGVSWAKFAEISITGNDVGVWEIRGKIEELLRRIPERLVLLIDDLDRIPANDLETVLRLVRLTGDFPNLVVVVSCDPVRLRPSPSEPVGIPALLEKTAQTVVALPPTSREVLDQYLYFSTGPAAAATRLSAIDRLLRAWKISPARVSSFEKEFTTYYQFELRFAFQTLRDVKRYLASLQLSLGTLWPEINLFDYLLLEYVKVFAIDVWSDVWDHSDMWVGSDLKRGVGLSPGLLDDERSDLKRFREHLDKLLRDRPNSEFLRSILGRLFPRAAAALAASKPSYSSTAFAEQRVQSWEHFGKYFRQAIDRGDIPDRELASLLDAIRAAADDSAVQKLVSDVLPDYKLSGSLRRFLQKLDAYSAELPEMARAAIVRSVALCSDQLSIEGWRDFASEFDAGKHLVVSTIDAVWQAHGPDLIRFVVTNSPRISFALVILSYTIDEPGRGAFWNLRSPELFESLRPLVLRRLRERFGPGKSDLLLTEGDNAIYVLIMWSRLGAGTASADLQDLMENNAELWARLVKGYLDPFGELRLKELASLFDPRWLRELGELHRAYLQADPAAFRVLEILARIPAAEGAGDPPPALPDDDIGAL